MDVPSPRAHVVTLTLKSTPYAHQAECLSKFGRKKAFALLAEMGTGKTWIIVNNVAQLFVEDLCDALLVVAPNGVHSNWTRIELPKHMPDEVDWSAIDWNAKANKTINRRQEAMLKPTPGVLRIVTMHWEAMQTKRGFEFAQRFVESAQRPMGVADESDAMKNPSALRTKNMLALKPFFAWRRIMSGTPINNAPFDAFSQFTFLDVRILKETSFFCFKAQYAVMLPKNNPVVQDVRSRNNSKRTPQIVARGVGGRPQYKNLDKLAALIGPHSFRVLKEECLDLPAKIYKTVFFDLTPEQHEVYMGAKRKLRLQPAEGETMVFTKLVAMTKLTQITSGYFLREADHEPERIPGGNPKLALLVERVQAIVAGGAQVIIWARYRVEIADIVAALTEAGITSVQYHGGVNDDDRIEAIDSFQAGGPDAFVGNQQSGGTGITLTAASFVIYFSNDFSLRNRLQSEDRAHRIGQREDVTYINIAAKGTVDEIVIDALANKKDVADAIIDVDITSEDDPWARS